MLETHFNGHGQYVYANVTAESCSLASRSVTKAIVGFSSIVLLEYITVDPSKGFSALHTMRRSLKRSDFTRYANLMCSRSDYIHYFVQILLKLLLPLNFNVSFIYYFNFNRRIKCGQKA